MNEVQLLIKNITSNFTKYGAPIARSCHRRCSIKKGVLKNLAIFTEKTIVLQYLCNKTAGLKAFLRTLTLKNTCQRLLLHRKYFSLIFTRSVAQLYFEQFSTNLIRSLLCSHWSLVVTRSLARSHSQSLAVACSHS